MNLDLQVKNLLLSYETLAERSVKLNQSYLALLGVYEQLIFAPDLLAELEKAGQSPLRVVDSLSRDRQTIDNQFTELLALIANTQKQFVSVPESTEISKIAHDCQVMQQFVKNIDLNQLEQMFAKISL